MKKALITGGKGFVGPYLKKELEKNDFKVIVSDLENSDYDCDITNIEKVRGMVNSIKPDYIFHLAGFSSVGESFKQPELCFKINVDGTKNLLKASKDKIKRILIVSSAEVYGKVQYIPIDESHPLNPMSPYAKSRVEQEKIALNSEVSVIICRSFNHTGPNQSSRFVIPSFRNQVKDASDGDFISCGNLDVFRDFSDVRDVVKAYRIIAEKGSIGEIYNVGYGKGFSLNYILNKFIENSGKKLFIKIDENKFRKADTPILVCDNKKILKLGVEFKHNLFED